MNPSASAPQRHFASFEQFYPFYLSEHRNVVCRRLHFIGTALTLCILAAAIASADALLLLAVPVTGYGFAWVGHFAFERNRPATFAHPWYSLIGDFALFRDILVGRIRF